MTEYSSSFIPTTTHGPSKIEDHSQPKLFIDNFGLHNPTTPTTKDLGLKGSRELRAVTMKHHPSTAAKQLEIDPSDLNFMRNSSLYQKSTEQYINQASVEKAANEAKRVLYKSVSELNVNGM